MCGIAGILGYSSWAASENILRSMRNAQSHRGPDDNGSNVMQIQEGTLGLAHTRLSILDVSPAGHQPMEDPPTGNWITYNGEIYNFRQLRDELEITGREQGAGSKEQGAAGREQGAGSGEQGARSEERWQSSDKPGKEAKSWRSEIGGRQSEVNGQKSAISEIEWRSQTDTEVILKAYARRGRDCLSRLRGMFAFALWDRYREELFLARDPFGVKPLYYYQTENAFVFASEVRALLASGLVPRKLSLDGLASYLECGSLQGPWTIVEGVRSLRPGHCLVVKLHKGRLQVTEQHYATDLFRSPVPQVSTRREAVEILEGKLEESVRCHLVSDVPVAAFLSGGIDSSAIVGLMRRVSDERPRTFTVTFSEKNFSEHDYANLVAQRFQTDHQNILLSEQRMLDMIPAAFAGMDQPTMDGINTFVVAKAVKQAGVTVALSGLGGDELFAGYPSFKRARRLRRMAMLPRGLRRSASALGRSLVNDSARHKKFWDMVDSDCSAYAACAISRQLFASAEIDALMPDLRTSARSFSLGENGDRRSQVRDQQSQINGWSVFPRLLAPGSSLSADPTNAVSVHELQGYMANTLLRDTDQMSMAHALEIRVPFIDSVVASYVLGLPGEWKVDGKRPKPLLLDALDDMLPEQVWHRPKMGYTLPFRNWMQSALQPEIDAALCLDNPCLKLGLEPQPVREVWSAFKKNPRRQSWSRPWALYVLKRWCELNGVTA